MKMSDEESKKLSKELQQADIKIKKQSDLKKIATRLNEVYRTAFNPFTGEKVSLEPLPETISDRDVDIIEAIKEARKKKRKLKGETIETHQNYLQLKQDGLTTQQQACHDVLLDEMYAADVRSEIGKNAQKAQGEKRNRKPNPFILLLIRILKENNDENLNKKIDCKWRDVLSRLETFIEDTNGLENYIRNNDKNFVSEILTVDKVSPKKPLKRLKDEKIIWRDQDGKKDSVLIRNLPTLITRARKKIKN